MGGRDRSRPRPRAATPHARRRDARGPGPQRRGCVGRHGACACDPCGLAFGGAGEDDEALALIETVPQIGQRTLVRGAGEEELGVRTQAKRLCPQSVELLVHRRPRQKAGTDIMCRYQHSFRSEDWNAALWKESSMDVLRPITEMPRIVSVLALRGVFSIRAMASTCTYGRPCGLRRVSQTIVEVTMGRRDTTLRKANSIYFREVK